MNNRFMSKKRWRVSVSVAIAAIAAPIAAQAEELLSEKDALMRVFQEPAEVSSQWIALSSNQMAQIKARTGMRDVPTVLRYCAVRSTTARTGESAITNDTVCGYTLVHTVDGKHGPIRLMVAVTPELVVIRTEILAFREQRGRSVREQTFLSQFTGKTPADTFVLRSDIDGVTGATVSSHAVAQGVREALIFLSVLTTADNKDH